MLSLVGWLKTIIQSLSSLCCPANVKNPMWCVLDILDILKYVLDTCTSVKTLKATISLLAVCVTVVF